jgi:hypothetical protein
MCDGNLVFWQTQGGDNTGLVHVGLSEIQESRYPAGNPAGTPNFPRVLIEDSEPSAGGYAHLQGKLLALGPNAKLGSARAEHVILDNDKLRFSGQIDGSDSFGSDRATCHLQGGGLYLGSGTGAGESAGNIILNTGEGVMVELTENLQVGMYINTYIHS